MKNLLSFIHSLTLICFTRLKVVCLAILMLTACYGLYAQVPSYMKTGGTGAQTIPLNQESQKTQLLYLPGDFGTLPITGKISNIYFRNTVGGASGTYTNFRVSFIQNTATAFPSTSYYTGLTTALPDTNITLTGNAMGGGWFRIPLTIPFTYDSLKTLIVEIRYTAKLTGSGLSTINSTATGNKRCSGQDTGATTGTTNTIWNDFGMDVAPLFACTDPATPGTSLINPSTSICAGTSVELNLSGNTTGYGQTFRWQLSDNYTGPYSDVSDDLFISRYLTTAPLHTSYYRSAVTCGSGTTYSTPVTVTVNPLFPAGTYTIDSSTATGGSNFRTFTEAVTAINCGIGGPIVFNVLAGTYNERIVIGNVPGTSATNTVSFIGAGKTSTTLTSTGTSAADFATVMLNGSDHILFRDMTIAAPGTAFGVGVLLTNGADSNRFSNLNIQMNPASTATTTCGIAITGTTNGISESGITGNYNKFDSLKIDGAYWGISIYGNTATLRAKENDISNCVFTNQNWRGIRTFYTSGSWFHHNNISALRNVNNYGIENSNISNFRIENNSISSVYGINIGNGNLEVYDPAFTSIIMNNLVNTSGVNSYGITLSNAHHVHVLHNTFTSNGIGSIATASFYNGCSHLDLRNNIFVNTSAGQAHVFNLSSGSMAYFDSLDYNNYYSAGDGLVYLSANAAYNTLSKWKTAYPNTNGHSYSFNPLFVSATDLRLQNASPAMYGTYTGITTDIDNRPRYLAAPTAGAYELVPAPLNASVAELVSPQGSFCKGTYDIKVKLRNKGATAINTLQVDWTLNGIARPTIYFNGSLDVLGSATGNDTIITLASQLFAPGAANEIKVWTSLPNGLQDTITLDDTLLVAPQSALSDTLTIGGAGANYATFTEAAAALNNYGICGPVLFNVQSGVFTERMVLREIPGASATNTITFKGAGKNNTRIAYKSTGTSDYGTVVLNGTNNITFRDMTVEALDTTYGIGILLTNRADSNLFTNLAVKADTIARGTMRGCIALVASTTNLDANGGGNCGDYNRFDSLDLRGGYFGIRMAGDSGMVGNGNMITNNTFSSHYFYGIHINYQKNFVIRGNTISKFRGNVVATELTNGIQFSYSSNYVIESNTILDAYSGIYLYYANTSYYRGYGKMINNMIVATTGSGLNINTTDSIDIYHNTVKCGGKNLLGTLYISDSRNINCQNNIFVNPNTSADACVVSASATSVFATLDYNMYYTYGGGFFYRAAVIYPSLAAWQGVQPSYNQNSITLAPLFMSDNNLRLKPIGKIRYGASVGVTQDIDGTVRSTVPVIGAHERQRLMNSAYVAAMIPQTFCAGTHPVSIKVVNSGVNIINTLTINWEVNGSAMPPVTLPAPIDTLESTAGAEAIIPLGNVSFSLGINTSIKAWISSPNGGTDPFTADDTIALQSQAALSGTFTINPVSGTYTTIAAAMSDVINNGICGPVTFNIADGTYNEQLAMGAYKSTDPSYIVTFQSASLDSSKVTIAWPAAATVTNNHIVKLDETRNVIFKGITFSRTGTGAFSTIVNLNNTNGIRFQNNRFIAPLSITTESDGSRTSIYSTDLVSEDSTVIENNLFSENANGVALFSNKGSQGKGTVVRNNIFRVPYVSIWLKHHQSARIIANSCSKSGTAAIDFFGISLENCDSAMEVSHNRIFAFVRGTGIRLLGCNGTELNRARIYNNMISAAQSGTSTCTGMSIESDNNYNAAYLDIAHNSILISASTTTTARVVNMAGTATSKNNDLRIVNNILMNQGTGYVYNIPANAIGTNVTINYNNIYTAGANIGTWTNAIAIANDAMRSWVSLSGRDSLSSNVNVSFQHADTLKLAGASLGDLNLATPLTGFATTDLYGTARTGTFFYKGAFEHSSPLAFSNEGDAGLWNVINPKSPLSASGTQDMMVRVRNMSIVPISHLEVNYTLNGALGSVTSWNGTLAAGKDTTLTIPGVLIPAGSDTLKIWTQNINYLSSDLNRQNDTLSLIFIASSPLSGPYNVGAGEAFLNLTAIADTLRKRVLGGDVVFELTSTYNSTLEVFPVVFSSPSGGAYTVTIRPATGVTNVITQGDPGSANPLIDINGTANLTFDGRAGGAGALQWTIRNTRTATTIGSVVRFINGAQFNRLRHLKIEGQSPTSHGIIFFSTAATALNGNNNNTVENCTIGNRSDITAADYYQAILSTGTTGNFNTGNTIRNNQVYNFSTNGIYLSTATGSNWIIEGNHFYYNRTTAQTTTCTVLNLSPDATATGYTISNNIIGGSAANAGGASWKHNGNNTFTAISSAVKSIAISNNTIRNIEQQNTGTSVRLSGIEQNLTASKATISYNKIANLKSTSRNVAFPVTGLFSVNGIVVRSADSAFVFNNTIDTLSAAIAAATTTDISLGAIVTTEALYADVYNNTISNLANLTQGVSRTIGIAVLNVPQNARHNIYNNTIALANSAGRMHGIMHSNITVQPGTINVTNNSVYIGGTQSGAGPDYALYRNIGTPLNALNNVFYFERTGTGTTVFESSAQAGLTANYNFYVHAGNAFSTGDFETWKAGGNDAFSYAATPVQLPSASLFANTASGNLSVVATNSASWALNGKGMANAGIATGITGNPRSTTAGIPVDLGAYEFTPAGAGANPVAVNAVPASPTTVLSVYNRPVATINWRSGTLPTGIALNYFSGTPPVGALAGNNINSYYSITATGGSGYVYDIELAYTPAELGNVNESNLSMAKKDGTSPWHFLGTSAVNMASHTVKDTLLNSFSLFTLTDKTNPLPVKLTSFTATLAQHDVMVKWTTASEKNAAYFIVEASADGRHFATISKVQAKGSSLAANSYMATHADAQRSMNGTPVIHYRLTTVDNDGSRSVSKVVAVNFNGQPQTQPSVVAYPNPFVSEITLRVPSQTDASVHISITDVRGRTIRQFSRNVTAGMNELSLDQLSDLDKGVYFIKIASGNETNVLKAIKTD